MDTTILQITGADDLTMLVRLGVAIMAGGLIGLERGRIEARPAGFRTMALIAMGACLFTLISIFGFKAEGVVSDPARVAAQIVTGVGFLGAGVMIRSEDYVLNLTTAASIWMAASLGMAAGSGLIVLTLAGAAAAFIILRFVPRRGVPKQSNGDE